MKDMEQKECGHNYFWNQYIIDENSTKFDFCAIDKTLVPCPNLQFISYTNKCKVNFDEKLFQKKCKVDCDYSYSGSEDGFSNRFIVQGKISHKNMDI